MTETLEAKLKTLIVETLALEDIDPASIESDAPLFGEGLGLDSIDALELALAVHSEFGVKTEEADPNNPEYYHSVASLAEFIRTRQESAKGAEQQSAKGAEQQLAKGAEQQLAKGAEQGAEVS